MCCSLQRGYLSICRTFPAHSYASDQRPGPKSILSSSLRVQFWMWVSSSVRHEWPLESRISLLIFTLFALIRVSGPPRHPWSTARTKIALPRGPEKSISNESILHASVEATPYITDISTKPDPLLGFVLPDRAMTLDRRLRPNSYGCAKRA